MYTELGRSCVVGAKVPQAMKDELEFCKTSRKMTLDLLKPGASCKDIWDAFNAFMRKNGRPMEARLYCHGQGYDLVERPLIRNDEPMTIEKDMNIVVHPTYIHGGYLNWLCDNYLIGGNGPGRPPAPVSGRDRRSRIAASRAVRLTANKESATRLSKQRGGSDEEGNLWRRTRGAAGADRNGRRGRVFRTAH